VRQVGLARLPVVRATLLQQAPAKVVQVAQAHLQLGTAEVAAAAHQPLAAMGLVQTVALVAQEQHLQLAARLYPTLAAVVVVFMT